MGEEGRKHRSKQKTPGTVRSGSYPIQNFFSRPDRQLTTGLGGVSRIPPRETRSERKAESTRPIARARGRRARARALFYLQVLVRDHRAAVRARAPHPPLRGARSRAPGDPPRERRDRWRSTTISDGLCRNRRNRRWSRVPSNTSRGAEGSDAGSRSANREPSRELRATWRELARVRSDVACVASNSKGRLGRKSRDPRARRSSRFVRIGAGANPSYGQTV